jgi:hypothetical protein
VAAGSGGKTGQFALHPQGRENILQGALYLAGEIGNGERGSAIQVSSLLQPMQKCLEPIYRKVRSAACLRLHRRVYKRGVKSEFNKSGYDKSHLFSTPLQELILP